MGTTGAYTTLLRLRRKDGDWVHHDHTPPKILHLKEWEEFKRGRSWVKDYANVVETERVVQDEYPCEVVQKWKSLVGFRDPDDMWKYRIHRVAWGYDKRDFLEFWSQVSRMTEPFMFYHSLQDGYFPDAKDFMTDNHIENAVLKVVCVEGQVKVEKVVFGVTNYEVLEVHEG